MSVASSASYFTVNYISPSGADYSPTERHRTNRMVNCPNCFLTRTSDGRVVPKLDAHGQPIDPLENQEAHYGGCIPIR